MYIIDSLRKSRLIRVIRSRNGLHCSPRMGLIHYLKRIGSFESFVWGSYVSYCLWIISKRLKNTQPGSNQCLCPASVLQYCAARSVFIAVLRAPPPSRAPSHSTLINGDLLSPHRPRSMTFPPFVFKHNIPRCTAARKKKKNTTEYTRIIGNTKQWRYDVQEYRHCIILHLHDQIYRDAIMH